MNGSHFIAIASWSVLLGLAAQNNQSRQMQMRDLTHYDKAGPYTIKFGLDGESPDKALAEIREFLWNHWHQRRLGHLLATFYSKEGEPSKNAFFIEPDPNGRWQITVEIARVVSVRRPGDKRKLRETTKGVYLQVERVEPPKDGLTPARVIADKDVLDSRTYRLRLRNQHPNEELIL